MWPSWVRTRAPRSTPCPSTALVAAAATPSLKDIPSLVQPEPAAQPTQSGTSPPRVFHRLRVAVSALLLLRALQPAQVAAKEEAPVAAGEEGGPMVLYFTSLQTIRSTFHDCKAVRVILQMVRAAVDERDLFKDKRFATELAALLPHRPRVTLPQLFVGRRHLGGAEEVRCLYRSGELLRIVAAAAAAAAPASCGRCGGERYVVCGSCDGRHRQYSYSSGGGHFRECADCNVNGLVRCPDCFAPAA
ncbi:unnamed protein product [Alopecurus aequalis]